LEVPPGYQSPDLHLDVGEHRLEVLGERNTYFGPRAIGSFTQHLTIDPKGSPVVLTVYEWAFQ